MIKHPAIGVFGYGAQGQALLLVDTLNRVQPGSAHYFDLGLEGNQLSTLGSDLLRFDGIDLRKLKYAYIHGLCYQYPVVPRAVTAVDWSLWQSGHVLDQQKFSYILSLVQELQRHGVATLSPLRALLGNFMKYEQLQQMRRLGCAVPPMICTNDQERATEFCARHELTVWRPATGHGAWQSFGARQLAHLCAPDKPPVIVCAVKPGAYVRSYYFAGKSLLNLQCRGPGYHPVETLETFWEDPELDTRECGRYLHEKLGHEWVSVALVPEGATQWIYDIDVDPIVLGLPPAHRDFLLETLARHLLQRPDTDALPTRPAGPQQRATLFLRRMLTVLFDMERSKHRPMSSD